MNYFKTLKKFYLIRHESAKNSTENNANITILVKASDKQLT